MIPASGEAGISRRGWIASLGGISLAAAARSSFAEQVVGAQVDLAATLHPYLAEYGLPALAAAAVQAGRTVAAGAVGTRRAGENIPVAINDRFHIGSDTKAITALLAAILVEAGKLRWDITVAEVFPELASRLDLGLAKVTLTQLLSHTSGLPSDNDAIMHLIEQSYAQQGLNLDELRLWLLTQWAGNALEAAPGTRFAYSNLGYTFVGAMLERATGATWEGLVAARVFDPLGLKSAGFGPQSSPGRVDAPVGHDLRGDRTLKPMLAGPNGDVPAIYGPAGNVHLSVLDFATWAGWNAGEGKRGPALVEAATLRKLHTSVIDMNAPPDAPPGTPPSGSYGLGWGVTKLPFSADPFVFHGGSNGMNLAYVMLRPANDFAMVMMTNVAGKKADQALLKMAETLYKRFSSKT